ncbi:CoA-binding protein [Thermosulfuriphilus sp.]
MGPGCELPEIVPPESEIAEVVRRAKTVAVVGMSPKVSRPSHQVGLYLKEQGLKVIPVNPGHDEIAGLRSYPDLASIPESERIDVVIIFRRPDQVGPIVEAAIKRGIKTIWMQEGIVNNEAAQKAIKSGAFVVMNRCFKKVHQGLKVGQ